MSNVDNNINTWAESFMIYTTENGSYGIQEKSQKYAELLKFDVYDTKTQQEAYFEAAATVANNSKLSSTQAIDQLHQIEIHCVMQYLDISSLLLFGRTSKWMRINAAYPFAWKHLHQPVRYVSSKHYAPPFLSPSAPLRNSKISFEIEPLLNDKQTEDEDEDGYKHVDNTTLISCDSPQRFASYPITEFHYSKSSLSLEWQKLFESVIIRNLLTTVDMGHCSSDTMEAICKLPFLTSLKFEHRIRETPVNWGGSMSREFYIAPNATTNLLQHCSSLTSLHICTDDSNMVLPTQSPLRILTTLKSLTIEHTHDIESLPQLFYLPNFTSLTNLQLIVDCLYPTLNDEHNLMNIAWSSNIQRLNIHFLHPIEYSDNGLQTMLSRVVSNAPMLTHFSLKADITVQDDDEMLESEVEGIITVAGQRTRSQVTKRVKDIEAWRIKNSFSAAPVLVCDIVDPNVVMSFDLEWSIFEDDSDDDNDYS